MRDLLLPRTDAGVAFQAVAAVNVYGPLLWATRSNRDMQTFVLGLAVLTFAWFALRTLH